MARRVYAPRCMTCTPALCTACGDAFCTFCGGLLLKHRIPTCPSPALCPDCTGLQAPLDTLTSDAIKEIAQP